MREDVLEQIVDDYLKFKGYFTTHNVRFRPSPDHPDYDRSQESVRSDVDVVGVDPRRTDLERVVVVSLAQLLKAAGLTALPKSPNLASQQQAQMPQYRRRWNTKSEPASRSRRQLAEHATAAFA